jgi:histone arginine demethylase JMJD6
MADCDDYVFDFLAAGATVGGVLAEDRGRFERRIARAKAKEYPRRSPDAWTKANYAASGLVDHLRETVPDLIPRIDAASISEQEFANVYERGSKPVVVCGLMSTWPAVSEGRWTIEALLRTHAEDRFKVGEDDDGYAVYVKLKYFVRYMLETKDDSPLYVFDSSFAEREGTRALRSDYALPRFFTDDLFKLVGERRRPPYRWLVLGPERSGSYIHIDPLGTSAWNALLAGHKCWACFPPGAPKEALQPPRHEGGREAIAWWAHVYPMLLDSVDPHLRPLTVIQRPGETMFVPGGWWHVVLNLDAALAVTQNFCSRSNFDAVWAKTRVSRPRMGSKFQEQLRAHAPDLYERSLVPLDETEQGNSSSSSSSSSYSSSSASERSEDEGEDDERVHDAEAWPARKRSPSSPTWRDRAREGVERECEEAEVNAEMGGRNQRQRVGHSPGHSPRHSPGEEGCQELDENGAHRK